MNVLLNRLALWWLSKQFKKDMDYAWGWHCNIAMAAVDAGCAREPANRGAAHFMKMAFGVDTVQP